MRSPIGDGARFGRADPGASVFARRVLRGDAVAAPTAPAAAAVGRSTAGVFGGTRSVGAVFRDVLIGGGTGWRAIQYLR